jgi:hypothetical protein
MLMLLILMYGALAHNGSAVTSGLTTYSSGDIIGAWI